MLSIVKLSAIVIDLVPEARSIIYYEATTHNTRRHNVILFVVVFLRYILSCPYNIFVYRVAFRPNLLYYTSSMSLGGLKETIRLEIDHF